MTDLLHPQVSPSPGAYGARPFDAVEIDEHVDCDRIWATILGVRNELERYEEAAAERVKNAEEGEREARVALENDDAEYVNVDDARAAFQKFAKSKSAKDLEALRQIIF